MGKVFTITEGLENLGAMKTGGQGSVYKGRRIGEIITAIKLLPTPIHTESEDDKSFVDFNNEVEKLKKVNENPCPNVVKILSSGVSDTGNFPFIEMEFIEGPDLEELLKPPHDPIFTIKEVTKVAEQLSHALAHCHKVEVRHGDIKSNNVKYNIHTGNYVLLDFGLAVMSDEQRRSSLRHAGAIEFMAPEQNEGQMLYQTDVYGLGIILFELLAGTVPFPLHDKGETARNNVRLSHMETPPPDFLELRRAALPLSWSDEKKEHEMHLPEWLVSLVYKCLEKKPENRFADGVALNEYIVLNSTLAAKKEEVKAELDITHDTRKLLKDKEHLQLVVSQYQKQISANEKELEELTALVAKKDKELQALKQRSGDETYVATGQKSVSRTAFFVLLFITIGLAALAAYSFLSNSRSDNQIAGSSINNTDSTSRADSTNLSNNRLEQKKNTKTALNQLPGQTASQVNNAVATNSTDSTNDQPTRNKEKENATTDDQKADDNAEDDTEKQSKPSGKYRVRNVAYFYNKPDESTRRNAFINHWNNAILNPLDDKDGFVYIVFTNDEGQVSKGWIRKKDLIPINDQ